MSIHKLLPWFFTFDHDNDACWLSVHLCDMKIYEKPILLNTFTKAYSLLQLQKNDFLINLDGSCTWANQQVRQRRWRKEVPFSITVYVCSQRQFLRLIHTWQAFVRISSAFCLKTYVLQQHESIIKYDTNWSIFIYTWINAFWNETSSR